VRDLLGRRAGMVTGAALLVDYLFTVAVSVAAITQIVGYLVPEFAAWDAVFGVGILAVMTVAALRMVKERVRIALTVWFGFLLVIAVMLVLGVSRHAEQSDTTWVIAIPEPSTLTVVFAY